MTTKQKTVDFYTTKKELENNIIKPIYVIYGEEKYLQTVILNKFKDYFSRQKQMVNYEIFYGEDLNFNQIAETLQTIPLGVGKQCVIIKHFEKVKTPFIEKISSLIDNISFKYGDLFLLFFLNSKQIPKSMKSKNISSHGSFVYTPRLNTSQIKQWIRTRCREEGQVISDEAIYYLLNITENDFAQVNNELDKIFCFLGSSGNKIDKDDIIINAFGLQGGNIFNLVDSVGERKTSEALRILNKLVINSEYHPLQILAMLKRQMRLILKVKIFSGDIKKIKGEKNLPPFVVNKLLSQSQNFNLEQLKKSSLDLLKTEMELKTGTLSSEIALERLIVRLTK